MSYPLHLICINNHYYYRISIPVDLKHYFPFTFIQKTLRTTSIRDAKPLLLAEEYKVQRAFTFLRSGMIEDDMALKMVRELLPGKRRSADSSGMECKQESAVMKGMVLSEANEQPRSKLRGIASVMLTPRNEASFEEFTRRD